MTVLSGSDAILDDEVLVIVAVTDSVIFVAVLCVTATISRA
jgi:hypothetical protein